LRSCLVCDDHAMLRDALSASIALGWPGAAIVEAGDFPAAWAAAAGHDLILSDLIMPGAPPREGIEGLLARAGGTPVIVITGNEDDDLLLSLYDLGIAGFLPKSSRFAIIENAIRLVLAGGQYLPPRILALTGGARPSGEDPARGLPNLTARQIDVLRRIALGESNKEIARAVELSPATVKTYAAAIFAALGAANRTEAALRARDLGLV
jgi:two-component system, NarL family, nitrate/nitrite response regulator NarL